MLKIYARLKPDGSYEVANGVHRYKTMLRLGFTPRLVPTLDPNLVEIAFSMSSEPLDQPQER